MPKENKDTRFELVEELEAITPRTPALEKIIFEAKRGEFHDFKNNKYVCGKVALVGYLMEASLHALANRVKQGEFDEQPDEEDKAEMRKDLPVGMHKAFGLEPGHPATAPTRKREDV